MNNPSLFYDRNRIYISKSNQDKLKDFKILIAGSGIGSMIAECALRLGFGNLTIIDGDTVDATNLNRQNYVFNDVGKSKAECISIRLKSINPFANINIRNEYITETNLSSIISDYQIAINALDFTSSLPLKFDERCQNNNIPVLHPYNLGWAGLAFVITPKGPNLAHLSPDYRHFENKVVGYILKKLRYRHADIYDWLSNVLLKYKKEEGKLPPPQLSVASYLLAGGCTQMLYKLAIGLPLKMFPGFYLFSLEQPIT